MGYKFNFEIPPRLFALLVIFVIVLFFSPIFYFKIKLSQVTESMQESVPTTEQRAAFRESLRQSKEQILQENISEVWPKYVFKIDEQKYFPYLVSINADGSETILIPNLNDTIWPRDHYDRDSEIIAFNNNLWINIYGKIIKFDLVTKKFEFVETDTKDGIEDIILNESLNLIVASDYEQVWIIDIKRPTPKVVGTYIPLRQLIGSIPNDGINFDNNNLIITGSGYGIIFLRINIDNPTYPYFMNSWPEGTNESPVKEISLDSPYDNRYSTFHGNSSYHLVHFYGHNAISLVEKNGDKVSRIIKKDLYADFPETILNEIISSLTENNSDLRFDEKRLKRNYNFQPMVHLRDYDKLIFYYESDTLHDNFGQRYSGGKFFVSYSVEKDKFDLMNISKHALPDQNNMKSNDGRYWVTTEKTNSDLSPKEVWLHDLYLDTSTRIFQTKKDETVIESTYVNGTKGPCIAEFWPDWLSEHVFKFSVYKAGGDENACQYENDYLNSYTYDIDKKLLLPSK